MTTGKAKRPLENLSSRQRRATPPAFAKYLLDLVAGMFRPEHVAVLYVARDSVYWKHFPFAELHGIGRNADLYAGPWPIIAHPPCGCWGKYKAVCSHRKECGINAIEFVHRFGGVIEQPVGSSLFKEHGRPGHRIEKVNQGDFGHQAIKPTLLYIVEKIGGQS